MTKNEYDYKRMLRQYEEIKKKMDEKKEALDKERDEVIIDAVRKVNASREQGFKLASLIADKESFETIMGLEIKKPSKKGVKKKSNLITDHESEVEDDE